MAKTFQYTSASHPKILNKFHNNQKIFNCPQHGKHSDWRLTKKKDGYEYIRCGYCYRDAASNFAKNNPIYALWNYAKQHSKNNKTKYNITTDDIEKKLKEQKNKCIYTRTKFNLTNNRASLDRNDPKKGYTPNNIQLTSISINIMKSDFSESKFIKLCKLIAKPLKNNSNELILLKSIKRLRTKEDMKNDIKLFKKEGKLTCTKHGLHERWYLDLKRQLIKCGECQLDYHKNKNSKKTINNKKSKIEKNKLNKKNILRFKEGKNCYCTKHGFHKKFRTTSSKSSSGRVLEYIKCRICEKNNARKVRKHNPLSPMFSERKYNAKKIGRKFDLKFNDIIEMYAKQKGKCALTNLSFSFVLNKPSLDRINSKKGYVRTNTQMVIYDANRMKSDLTEKTFKKNCNLVNKYY